MRVAVPADVIWRALGAASARASNRAIASIKMGDLMRCTVGGGSRCRKQHWPRAPGNLELRGPSARGRLSTARNSERRASKSAGSGLLRSERNAGGVA
eukprot:5836256-Alexandrium_andersonii.AAC.1